MCAILRDENWPERASCLSSGRVVKMTASNK